MFEQGMQSVSEDANYVHLVVTRIDGLKGVAGVTYTTSDGTATGDADFQQTSEVVYFMDRETSKTITIAITNDTTYESPDETFTVTLSTPTGGAAIGTQKSTVVTILDDGDAGTFEFSSTSFSGSEDSGKIGVTITRVGGSSTAVTIAYSTTPVDADGSDYTSETATKLEFGDGETEKVVGIAITNDTIYEEDEVFNVSLVSVSGGGHIGSLSTTQVTITDDGDAGTLPTQDYS